MLNWVATGTVLIGAAGLVYAQWTLVHVLLGMPRGYVRTGWAWIGTLIPLFTLGYLAYIPLSWGLYHTVPDLLVPVIFLLGGCFACMVLRLAHHSIESIQQLTRLQHESITDPLTGIFNRRYLDRRLEEEMARAWRYQQPLSIVMLDIDDFKAVNDRLGHQTGDHVLATVARRVASILRRPDVLARFGGEEFMVLAPSTHLQAAISLGEKLRTAVAHLPVDLRGHEHIPDCAPEELTITVSVGIGTLDIRPESNDSLEALIQRTDDALYRAKAGGRNRCEACNDFPDLTASL